MSSSSPSVEKEPEFEEIEGENRTRRLVRWYLWENEQMEKQRNKRPHGLEELNNETPEERRERHRAENEKWMAEEARRKALHPVERLSEDGAKLRKEIETHDDMKVTLEESATSRAMCRAGRDCFFYRPGDDRNWEYSRHGDCHPVHTPLRILVEGVRGDLSHWRTKHYYHVVCFSAMMDVEDLIPSKKFSFERGPPWGLMVMKWEMYRGRVDIRVLAEFVRDTNEWFERNNSRSFKETEVLAATVEAGAGAAAGGGVDSAGGGGTDSDAEKEQATTASGSNDEPKTTPPPVTTSVGREAQAEEVEEAEEAKDSNAKDPKPVLRDYITDPMGGASLWQLAHHPDLMDGAPLLVRWPNHGVKAHGPFAEVWEEDPTEEEKNAVMGDEEARAARREAGLEYLRMAWDKKSNNGKDGKDGKDGKEDEEDEEDEDQVEGKVKEKTVGNETEERQKERAEDEDEAPLDAKDTEKNQSKD